MKKSKLATTAEQNEFLFPVQNAQNLTVGLFLVRYTVYLNIVNQAIDFEIVKIFAAGEKSAIVFEMKSILEVISPDLIDEIRHAARNNIESEYGFAPDEPDEKYQTLKELNPL